MRYLRKISTELLIWKPYKYPIVIELTVFLNLKGEAALRTEFQVHNYSGPPGTHSPIPLMIGFYMSQGDV